MEVSQAALFSMLFAGIVSGTVLGAFYDLLRLIRRSIVAGSGYVPAYAVGWKLPFLGMPGTWYRQNRLGSVFALIVTVLCDVLFGFLCGIVVVLLLYAKNDGVFRLSAPFGVAVGFFLYHFTVGRLTSVFTDVILFFTGILSRYLFLIVSLPIRVIYRGIRRLTDRLVKPLIVTGLERVSRRRSDRRIGELLRRAENAFLSDVEE